MKSEFRNPKSERRAKPEIRKSRIGQGAHAVERGIYAASSWAVQETLEISDAPGARTLKRRERRAPAATHVVPIIRISDFFRSSDFGLWISPHS